MLTCSLLRPPRFFVVRSDSLPSFATMFHRFAVLQDDLRFLVAARSGEHLAPTSRDVWYQLGSQKILKNARSNTRGHILLALLNGVKTLLHAAGLLVENLLIPW